MFFNYDGVNYDVIIERKNNKNTYIRIKNNCVFVTTNYFSSDRFIKKLINDNYDAIVKMIEKSKRREMDKDIFLLFGKKYDIVYGSSDTYIDNGRIYVRDEKAFNKWLNSFVEITYNNHLKYWYDIFEENIPKPNLKIRKMKTRWGVCNRRNNNVTLNLDLYRYDVCCLDYVIVHELSHFIEGNHSKKFWMVVEKYYPNYKEVRKKLRG